ncbi:glucose-1-phosphate thymidylyltransferase RfbA [Arsukibacterium sp.]|uniref:glucose-1-phosphate thymidylyltransferase RfbA n=1 Tax=Arsukibacterium sp. TaxID=1977258 RepID=UPI00299F4E72|nr:glucose-1-phosphate thymidylyltransferase RfbA [Arsukibacterium sp.]MDX1538568.1 glucose-1-phosphate thymidylyltransferase RfbA [Arsukibacterium sp.]
MGIAKAGSGVKGIVLAGGTGSRLHPITRGVSKQLLPIFDKPMIYYPISVLMLAGIRDILIITTAEDQAAFKRLLGDGSDSGVSFSYCIQPSSDGIAQAFILAEDFLAGSPACLVLGDNIFIGHGFSALLQQAKTAVKQNMATIFGYRVSNPERYGVAEVDSSGKVVSIAEKPSQPKSHYAVTGLYFYPADVVEKARLLKPSARGELEITDLNQQYLQQQRLALTMLGRGFAWLDTGTPENLQAASAYIEVIEKRQGLKVACLEEIAYESGYITREKLAALAAAIDNTQYGQYLLQLLE